MRILITGTTGMVGSYLAEYLIQQKDIEIYGTFRRRSRMDNLDSLKEAGKLNIIAGEYNIKRLTPSDTSKLNLLEADINDPFSIQSVIATVKPDCIFHLASQSIVAVSWKEPAETLNTNIIGTVNLLESVRATEINPVIHIAGSSDEYGYVLPNELPIKETNPLRPLSPYGVSKVAQEMLANQYFMSYGLKTIVTRGFNIEGPRRGEEFVSSSLAKQIAEIERGLRDPVIYVGDIYKKRDWSDVRDIVKAYMLLVEQCTPGEVYNIGSGIAMEIGELLTILLSMTDANITIKLDPSKLRPSDPGVLVCDATKFQKVTGWQPVIPFTKTLKDLLDYWRERV
jgi:GDP-4-dehydro-6-deoxy-D-mannose reductase